MTSPICMMYSNVMLRINIYIPEELNQQLELSARFRKKVKAEVIREALEAGLRKINTKSKSAQALLDLAKMAEKIPSDPNDPKDLSYNHDYYTWGGEQKEEGE